MKKKLLILFLSAGLTFLPTQQAHAVWWVVVKEVLKKVLKALDIAVQQLQNKTIWLQNAQKELENAMTKLKLDEIAEWTEKQKDQYAKYYDELRNIKEILAGYYKVKEIISKQAQIVAEYKKAIRLFRQDENFFPAELEYMEKVYAGIMDESLKNLDQLFLVVKALSTQMTDGKRMEIINIASDRIDENLSDLRAFNIENIKVSIQRSKDSNDIEVTKKLYGL